MATQRGDTIANDISTTAVLSFDGNPSGIARARGFINGTNDQDFFRIELDAGELYQFIVDDGGNPDVDPTLALRDAAGAQLAFDDNGGVDDGALLLFRPTTAGVYYLDIGGAGSTLGGYGATVREVPASVDSYATLAIGSSAGGNIRHADDQDFFGVFLTAGQSYIFDASGFFDTTLALRDAAGLALTFNDDGGIGVNARIEFTATTTGTYFLDVGGFGDDTGTYTLAARIDDVADDIDTTANLTIGSSRTGTIGSTDDQDFFRIFLTAGQTYIFDAIGSFDTTLALRNAAGVALTFNDDGGVGVNARIEFTATSTGTHYLDVGGFGTNAGTYSLAARIDDVADDVETTDSLALGSSRSGTIIGATDQDFFRIFLTAGQSYIFDSTGAFDSTLALSNAAGMIFNDDGGIGTNARIEFTAATTGNYFLDVGGFGANVGAYTLAARIDDAADDIETTDSLALGGFRSGAIDSATDQDFFRIFLTAGTNYIFDSNGAFQGTLTLRDAAGDELRFDIASVSGHARIEFTATISDTYFLDVGVFEPGTGPYTVAARVDDVADDIETTDFITADTVARSGSIETAIDQDFFRTFLTAGTSYVFEATGFDTTLALRDAAGNQLVFDDDGGVGANSRIEFFVVTPGFYYLDVGGFSTATGNYTLDARVNHAANGIDALGQAVDDSGNGSTAAICSATPFSDSHVVDVGSFGDAASTHTLIA